MTFRPSLSQATICLVAIMAPASVAAADGAAHACGYTGGNAIHGKKIFDQTCIACHGAKGKGVIPGTPDFTKKDGVLSKPHAALTDHITNGFSSPSSPMAMPPRGGNPGLTDQDIRDVHAYLHEAFGCGK